jgi:hypothetical protein
MPGRITPQATTEDNQEGQHLPVLPVSSQPIVCVEHPCIIKNLDRGIRSLGGDYAINKVCLNELNEEKEINTDKWPAFREWQDAEHF